MPGHFRTYFSHSYRSADRELNRMVWEALAPEGFYFTVDPPTDHLSSVYLEWMLRYCSCFVAAVPASRSGYIDFEISLATMAGRDGLLVVDRRVPESAFRSWRPGIVWFEHDRLERLPDLLADEVGRLATRLGAARQPIRPRGSVGLLMSWGKAGRGSSDDEEARAAVRRAARSLNFTDVENTDRWLEGADDESSATGTLRDMAALERHDFVVLDVSGTTVPPDVVGMVLGLSVPAIKLVRVPESTIGSLPPVEGLPSVVQRLAIPASGAPAASDGPGPPPNLEALTFWSTTDDLEREVRRALARFADDSSITDEERALVVLDDAARAATYFQSLGRARGRIFLSSASEDRSLADLVAAELERQRFDVFHYREQLAGNDWPRELNTQLGNECTIFLPLITPGFHGSRPCRLELRLAKQREQLGQMVIVPFTIDGGSTDGLGSTNAVPVDRSEVGGDAEAARLVTEAVDRRLRVPVVLKAVAHAQARRLPTAAPSADDLTEEAFRGQRIRRVTPTFFHRGKQALRAVARVRADLFLAGERVGTNRGTGWLVAPGLLLTCWHVVAGLRSHREDPRWDPVDDLARQTASLAVDFGLGARVDLIRTFPAVGLAGRSHDLDYALLELQPEADGAHGDDPTKAIGDWGFLPVAPPTGHLELGAHLNVPQYPARSDWTDPILVAMRENVLRGIDAGSATIRYNSDTDEGASGAPVCDDSWRVWALHRGSEGQVAGPDGQQEPGNVGTRLTEILADLATQDADLARHVTTISAELSARWDADEAALPAGGQASV